MKVVLLKDIKKTGKAYSVVDVSDGHAVNFLIPRKLAIQATPSAMKQVELRKKQADDRRALDEKLIEDRLSALAEERIVFTKKANEQGHLYDALDAAEIAQMTNLPEDAIRIEKPFKDLGTFEVPVAYGENFGKISVIIEAE